VPGERSPQRERRRPHDDAAKAIPEIAPIGHESERLVQRGVFQEVRRVLRGQRGARLGREGVERPEFEAARALLVGRRELLRSQAGRVDQPTAQRTEAVRLRRVKTPARIVEEVERAVDVAGEEASEVGHVLARGAGRNRQLVIVAEDPGERRVVERGEHVHLWRGASPRSTASTAHRKSP
jgi:hypothetical protein